MYVESCTILVVVNCLSRPVVVLDGLPDLYGFKYDSATACGPPLYLYSYKLVGSATPPAGRPAPRATHQPLLRYVGSPPPPRLHLHHSLSRFDPRAHGMLRPIYISLCPPPSADP